MFKKFFSIVGVMGLICFSFYYTHLATVVVKNNDPIMKKIINVSKTYTQKPVNATFSNNSIIPGVSGLEVDLDKSYESMKKYGAFNEDLVVLKSVTPLVSVSNIYDKYILYEIDLQPPEFYEASVIGSVISKYQFGIGDDFIARRIEKFIGDGTLEFTGNKSGSGRIYNCILRKCT